jgi:hypothetical protein
MSHSFQIEAVDPNEKFVLSRDGVSIDGVWFGNWIYWKLLDRNYK